VQQNGKKALVLLELSEHKRHCMDGKTPSGKTPSGRVHGDCFLFARRVVHKEVKDKQKDCVDDATAEEDNLLGSSEDEQEEEKDDADDMPSSCFFLGFVAFAIWGPIVPHGFDKDCKCQVFFTAEQQKNKNEDCCSHRSQRTNR